MHLHAHTLIPLDIDTCTATLHTAEMKDMAKCMVKDKVEDKCKTRCKTWWKDNVKDKVKDKPVCCHPWRGCPHVLRS